MDLMTLVAKLTLDSSEYEQGLGDAENSGGKFGKSIKSAVKGVGVAMAAVTTATAAAGGAFVKGAGSVAEYGDNIDKMSQKMGLSAEKYQEWDAILQHSGTSMESMKASMKTLANAAETGSDAFQQLGLSQEQIANMSQEELFEATIAGLQNVEDTTQRTYLAGKLLGRGATELGALLNTSAEDTEAMRQRVHELGGVMSDEAVKASARYQDSLQDMTTAIDGAKRGIMGNFLPALADAMDGIGNLLSGDSETGFGQIKQGVSSFIETMTEAIPRVIEFGSTIVSALGQAIIDNLPTLLEAGLQAILQLAQGISDNLPTLIPAVVDAVLMMVDTLIDNIDLLIDAAIQLGLGIAEGLIQAIPQIIERIPTIIAKIIDALTSNIPKIAAAGVKLIGSLVKNLPAIIASIIKAVPKIIASLVKSFGAGNAKMARAGLNLIKGLGRGLIEGASWVIQKAREVAGNILSAIKGFFGIHSPSKVMMTVGRYIDEGLAEGIRANVGMAKEAMDSLSNVVSEPMEFDPLGFSEDAAFDILSTPDTVTSTRNDGSRDVTVILQLDRTQLARTVFRLNNEETQRVGVNLAGGFA